MAKKYEKYKITVQYLNGDIEDVNLMGINTSSHSKMLAVYHRIKNTYSEKVNKIDFVGVGQDGSIKIMFTKEIKPKGREDLRQDINDIMINIANQMQLIKDKNFYHFGLIEGLSKKQDVKLHELEGLEQIKFKTQEDEDKEILRIGKELKKIRVERRWHKNQLLIISKLQENKIGNENVNFTHLSNIFKTKYTKAQIRPLNMKLAEDLKIYKEEIIKDKDRQIEKLKKNYNKVIIDEVENKIICYNKAKVV